MIWGLKENEKVKASPELKGVECPICSCELISKCGSVKAWHWSHKSNKDCDDWYEPESEWHLNWKDNFPKEEQEVTIKKCISDYCNRFKYHAPCSHINCVDCIWKIHRADIKTSKKGEIGNFNYQTQIVIELQNSPISSEKIKEREKFYGDMIWLLNGKTLAKNLYLKGSGGPYRTFRWKHPPKSWWAATKPIYIDLNHEVITLKQKLKEYLNDPNKKHYSTYKTQVHGEWEDDYGNSYESQYPHWEEESIEDTSDHIKYLKKVINLYDNKIFEIKKIYKNIPCGGWGYLISKKEFLNEVQDGNED